MADYNLTSKSPNKNANQPTEVPRFENSEASTNNYKLSGIDKEDVAADISTSKVFIDHENGRLVVNDGTRDRIRIGYVNGSYILDLIDSSGNTVLSTASDTITGMVFRTGLSGQRVEIASNQISIYDGSNVERQRIGGASQAFWDASGNLAGQIYSTYYAPWGLSIIHIDSVVRVEDDMAIAGPLTCESDLNVLGAKDFNIPHPTKKGKRLVYSSVESPEVLLMCRGKKGDEIPQHFKDITEKDTMDIITGVDGNWLATAVRSGYLGREIEPDDSKGSSPLHQKSQRKVSVDDVRQSRSRSLTPNIEPK